MYGRGTEPDPRFSLANERTALAWVRTALALVATGIGLASLARLAGLSRFLDVVAGLLCALGGFVAISAVLGWRRAETALRTARPLPAPVALPWLAGSIVVTALVLAGYIVTQR